MKIIGIGIIALLLFMLQRKIYERYWNKDLNATVFFAQSGIAEGDKGEVIEIVENRKYLPLSMLKVKFQTSRFLEFPDDTGSKTTDQYYRNEIFQIGGGERITRRLSFVGKRRGYYQISDVDMVGTDLFLTNEMMQSLPSESFLYVYPRTYDSREFRQSLQRLNGEVLVKRHLLEDPFEYRGIREYQPFDDIRSVNWKATARTGALKVNQKNYTALQTIRIFMNLEDTGILKKEEAVEASMQIVMGLAAFFLSQGIKVACYANGKDVLTETSVNIAGGAGAGQQDVIGKALARIDTQKGTWSFCELFEETILHDSQGTITMFVSPNGYADYMGLLEKCESEGIDYTWFYPYAELQEPEVPESIRKNVQFLHVVKG